MMNTQRIQELLGVENLSTEKLEQIRDEFHALAELVLESWLEKTKN